MKLHVLIFLLAVIISALVPLHAQNTEPVPLRARWSPTGERVAVTDGQNLVIYDKALVEQRRVGVFKPDDGIYASSVSVEWSPNGDRIGVYGSGQAFRGYQFWDVETGENLGQVTFDGWQSRLFWLPDEAHVAIHQGEIGEIFIYRLEGTQVDTWAFPIESLNYGTDDPNDTVTWNSDLIDMDWTPDGQLLLTTAIFDRPVDIWNGHTQEPVATMQCIPCKPFLTLHLSPKGSMVLFGGQDDDYLEVATVPTLDFVDSFTIPDETSPYDTIRLFMGWRSESHIWSAASDGFLYVWRFKVKAPLGQFPIDLDQVQDINPDGTQALYGDDNTLRVVDIESGEVLAETVIETDAVFIRRPWEPDLRG